MSERPPVRAFPGSDGTIRQPCAFLLQLHMEREDMGKGILLWLIGVPIPVIIILWLLFH
jgi:hypothetical protein